MDEQEEKQGLEINVGIILRYLLHKWWILLICLFVGATAGAIFGKIKTTTTYTTEAVYIVGYDTPSAANADYQTRLLNIATNCKTVLEQNKFREAVITQMQSESYGSEYKELKEKELADYITVSVNKDDGCFISVSITTEDQQFSVRICDSITTIFKTYLAANYPLTGDEQLEFGLVNTPETPEPEKSNDLVTFTLIFAVVGLLGAAVVLAIYYLADTRVKSGEELSERYGASVLGAIPDIYDKDIANVGSYGSTGDKEKENAAK